MALPQLYIEETKYRQLLMATYAECEESNKYQQMGCMADPDRVRVATTIHSPGPKQPFTLVYPASEGEVEREEVILRVQGFVVDSELPPIVKRTQLSGVPFRTRQSLTISGLGSEVFLKSVLAAGEIHGAFKAVNPHLNFSAWQPRQSRGHTVLTFTNRYFTPDTEDGHEVRPFPSDLDPMRILRNAVPDGIYTTDNEVRYHDRQSVTGESDSYTYPPILPQNIKTGDLVEVQCSFHAASSKRLAKQDKYTMYMKLRAVCVLDRSVQRDLNIANIESLSIRPASTRLKRRIGYGDGGDLSDVDLKRLKLAQDTGDMHVDKD